MQLQGTKNSLAAQGNNALHFLAINVIPPPEQMPALILHRTPQNGKQHNNWDVCRKLQSTWRPTWSWEFYWRRIDGYH
jgi:hypothetical protein